MSDREQPRRRTRPHTCCVGCVGGVLACAAVLYVVYLYRNRPARIVIPTPPMPAANASVDFDKAAAMSRALVHKSPYSMPIPAAQAYTPANFAACAKEAAPILPVLRAGFAKTYRDKPIRTLRDAAGPFRQFAGYREVARTLAGMARHHDLVGKAGRAADIRLDGEEMGVMVGGGGSLIADLVGIAVEAISLSRFEEGLAKLSPAELAHVAGRLDRVAARRVSFADVMAEEGCCSTSLLMDTLKGIKSPRDQLDFARGVADMASGKSRVSRFMEGARATMMSKAVLVRSNLDYYQAVAKECRGPYRPKSAVPVPRNPWTEMAGGSFTQGWSKHVVMEAVLQVLRAEVALYRCRASRGRYPDGLSSLVPTYLKAVPDDPFGGKAGVPLRYRLLQSGGFLLYSVGPDMRDDGGMASKRYPGETPGDIVAGKLWPRRSGR